MTDVDEAVIVALGSNLPGGYASSRQLLDAALGRFAGAGLPVAKASRWWRAPAWPDPSEPDYLNGVAIVETDRSPVEVLAALLELERDFGRERGAPNAPRTLDLDLIAHGRRLEEGPGLSLPHPRAHLRAFVMGPLAEIAPTWRHPVTGRTARDLARDASHGRGAAPD
ncbi:MAG TPA: 2-amino-4-hydroxy-6-hydroxymethyldihydropteridine diphosphokinase [Caulobacteraceae bacterium]|nr:2-amino-4-hydroxy-6-hydroxymethyldihydropteridine diphosphokinase [Caulobacteraceae bacterium]